MLNLFLLLTFFNPRSAEVPVLCYHNVYTGNTHEPGIMYISSQQLNLQLKTLSDSGYHSISPDQLYGWLLSGKSLPPKPFLLTFDDSRKEHSTLVAPLLEKYGFRASFFVMTVTIGKKGYLSAGDIQYLHKQGNNIGAHTWDHPHLLKTGQMDVEKQIIKPRSVLEKITGSPVTTFAYPFGEWNDWMIEKLHQNGYILAFRLLDNKNSSEVLYTIRRMMVSGTWSGEHLITEMNRKFWYVGALTNKNHPGG